MNLGFVAALTECLMQCHAGVIELLPAVPPELVTGSVPGIVAWNGCEVSVDLARFDTVTLRGSDFSS